ncbi:MAG: nickel-dependent hydrogenase large subunit [Candidatus Brocadiae bacterium]|nr:nickel-dependent hydrogenase large subunit [Candidatus Brocadiia bacterium]
MKRTVVPIGPFHPILEEPLRFELHVEGEHVVDADVRISHNHRGMEKMCEGLSYDQIPFLLARVCGICSASHPMAFCNALEDLCGCEVPPRAQYIRTLICELERLHSHLLWVGLAGHFIGYNTVYMWAWKYREPILDLFEKVSGSRNHYENHRVGGVRRDIPDEVFPAIRKTLDELEPKAEMLLGAVIDDPVIHARTKGVGVLRNVDAVAYGVTGPTARGSGVNQDIRDTEPYAAYDKVDWKVVVQPEGDVFAKAAVRLLENFESIKIIRQCLDQIEPGPICADVRELPEGEGIGHAEAPRGETFHYVRSDGTNRPVRYKVRAPTFVNVPSFKANVIGAELADAMLIVAAMDPCYSCTQRMSLIRDDTRQQSVITHDELLQLSWAKTERIRRQC